MQLLHQYHHHQQQQHKPVLKLENIFVSDRLNSRAEILKAYVSYSVASSDDKIFLILNKKLDLQILHRLMINISIHLQTLHNSRLEMLIKIYQFNLIYQLVVI